MPGGVSGPEPGLASFPQLAYGGIRPGVPQTLERSDSGLRAAWAPSPCVDDRRVTPTYTPAAPAVPFGGSALPSPLRRAFTSLDSGRVPVVPAMRLPGSFSGSAAPGSGAVAVQPPRAHNPAVASVLDWEPLRRRAASSDGTLRPSSAVRPTSAARTRAAPPDGAVPPERQRFTSISGAPAPTLSSGSPSLSPAASCTAPVSPKPPRAQPRPPLSPPPLASPPPPCPPELTGGTPSAQERTWAPEDAVAYVCAPPVASPALLHAAAALAHPALEASVLALSAKCAKLEAAWDAERGRARGCEARAEEAEQRCGAAEVRCSALDLRLQLALTDLDASQAQAQDLAERAYGHEVRLEEAEQRCGAAELRCAGLAVKLHQATGDLAAFKVQVQDLLEGIAAQEVMRTQLEAHQAKALRTAAEAGRASECTVCLDSYKLVGALALNCGHLLCTSCAPQCTACPSCKAVVTQRIKLYGF